MSGQKEMKINPYHTYVYISYKLFLGNMSHMIHATISNLYVHLFKLRK